MLRAVLLRAALPVVAACLLTLPVAAQSAAAAPIGAPTPASASATTTAIPTPTGGPLDGLPRPPQILLVTAHPDDDALFAGAVYKTTHVLGGKVDLFLVTNGEGGFTYSTLAEAIYGLDLTDPAVGREHLPGIRKRELLAGGAIVGIRNYFFLDQKDGGYTTDLDALMASDTWDFALVRKRLAEVIAAGDYDFVFVMTPATTTHAHHAAAAVLALETLATLPAERRPVVLAGGGYKKGGEPRPRFLGRDGYPLTRIREQVPPFEFDRSQKFGANDRLDYNIVVNWLIAEHKSQGTMQLVMNVLDVEQYGYFELNGDAGVSKAAALFDALRAAPNPR